ncbi:MAG: LacI family DNA-binding transcriptional regulator [Opitutales bacterium]
MEKGRAVTLGDIAESLSLSKSTVSRALRGDTRISSATRKRVRVHAEQVGYQPDPLISSLASHGWRKRQGSHAGMNVAYIIHNAQGIGSRRFPGAQQRAEQLGYVCDCLNIAEHGSIDRLIRVAYSRGIRGLIVGFTASQQLAQVQDMPWDRFSVVASGIGSRRLPMHSVSINGVEAMHLAWRKATESGARRLGLAALKFERDSEMDHQKYGTFLLRQLQLPEALRLPVWRGTPRDYGSLRKWVEEHRPDCVFGTQDSVYQMLPEAGSSTSLPYSFISLYAGELQDQRISGIANCGEHIGSTAMDLLDAAIQRHEPGLPGRPLRVMLDPEWREGRSLRQLSR